MFETFDTIDRAVFMFVNVRLANPVTDFIMPIITSDNLLKILYLITVLVLLWKGNTRVRWMVLASALVLTVTDQLSAGLIKPVVGRLRPCHVLQGVHLLVDCGGGKAMPSSHAANAFGQAVLFALQFRFLKWYLLVGAFLIAISRTFVGVHYPGDIIVGGALGSAVGAVVSFLFTRFYRSWSKVYRERTPELNV